MKWTLWKSRTDNMFILIITRDNESFYKFKHVFNLLIWMVMSKDHTLESFGTSYTDWTSQSGDLSENIVSFCCFLRLFLHINNGFITQNFFIDDIQLDVCVCVCVCTGLRWRRRWPFWPEINRRSSLFSS